MAFATRCLIKKGLSPPGDLLSNKCVLFPLLKEEKPKGPNIPFSPLVGSLEKAKATLGIPLECSYEVLLGTTPRDRKGHVG
jgi:hypothetical protein